MLRCHAKIKLADHRKENRDGQQDHREAVHEAAKDEVKRQHDDQHRPCAIALADHPRRKFLRHLGKGKKAVVERSTENDKENHARGCRCGDDAFFEHAPRHIARNERDEACACRANRSTFCGREPTRIDAANDEAENNQNGPDIQKRAPALGHGNRLARTRGIRVDAHINRNRYDIAEGRENPRNKGREKKLRDVLLGQDRIDHEDDRRGNKNAKCPASGERGCREAARVAVAAQLWQGDAAHCGGCRERRTTD